jgi:Ca2+-binding RTX toxin-like protein
MVGPRRLIQFVSVTVMVGVALGLFAAPVSGSTAQLVDVVLPPECKFTPPGGVCPPGSATVLVYQAERGEANRVSVASSGQELRVSDPGAAIHPGRGCTPIERHRVNCSEPGRVISDVFIDSGDGADTVNSRSASVTVNGGRGDDLLVGGRFRDVLYGGPGADRLRGRDGGDLLYDASPRRPFLRTDLAAFFPPPFFGFTFGSRTAVPLAGPGRGRDYFDGGSGRDTISYEGRLAGVTLDLADAAAVAGGRREHDSIRGVQGALGGVGDDRLVGSSRSDLLDGTRGDDRIVGREAADFIEGGTGRNVIIAGPGDDLINSQYRPTDLGAERTFCGSGMDHVSWIFPSDFLNDDCEDLEFNFLRDGGLFGGDVRSQLPLRTGVAPLVLVAPELWCHFVVNPSGCRLTLDLLVDGPASRRGTAPPRGTLLGSESYKFSPDERKSVSLSVSPAGLRILRRHGALQVRVRVTEDAPHQPGGYLTVLRAP